MLGRAIWNKLPQCIFENFENVRVKRREFQIFQNLRGWFIAKIARNKHVITNKVNHTKPIKTVLKLISFKSRQLQISEREITKQRAITNNTVNGAMLISINCFITWEISREWHSRRTWNKLANNRDYTGKIKLKVH